ncbi:MAG: DNA-binding protein [Candidatus Cloacimonetes bacterium]|nr:DNA-binding protein [Candidatus Cloacimonadota bacterium]
MPLKYTINKIENNIQKKHTAKYYAFAKSDGIMDLDDISKRIQEISTVSSIDTIAVIEGLIKVVGDGLVDGKTMKLGKFGIFSISIRSEGVEELDKFSLKNIVQYKINFLPGSYLKRLISNLKPMLLKHNSNE